MENTHIDENGTDLTNAICLVDSHHGVYIPQFFAQQFGQFIPDGDNKMSLLNGPDDEWYNDAWDSVEQNTVIEIEGKKYSLYHNMDLWAIPVENV